MNVHSYQWPTDTLNFNSNRSQGVTMMTIFVVSMMAIWVLIVIIVFAKKDQ